MVVKNQFTKYFLKKEFFVVRYIGFLIILVLLTSCKDGVVPTKNISGTDVQWGRIDGEITDVMDVLYKTNPPPWILNYAKRLDESHLDYLVERLEYIYNDRKPSVSSYRKAVVTDGTDPSLITPKADARYTDADRLQNNMLTKVLEWVGGVWCGMRECGEEERNYYPTPNLKEVPPDTSGLVTWSELMNSPAAEYYDKDGMDLDQCYLETVYGIININELPNYPGNQYTDYWDLPEHNDSTVNDMRHRVYCLNKKPYTISTNKRYGSEDIIDYYMSVKWVQLTTFKFVYKGIPFFTSPGYYDVDGDYKVSWPERTMYIHKYLGDKVEDLEYLVLDLKHRFYNEGGHTVIGPNMPWLYPSQVKVLKSTDGFMFMSADLRPLDGSRASAILGEGWDVRKRFNDEYSITGAAAAYYGVPTRKERTLWKKPDLLVIADDAYADPVRPGIPIYTAMTNKGTGDIEQCKLRGYVMGVYNNQVYYRLPYGIERESEKMMRYDPIRLKCEEEPV